MRTPAVQILIVTKGKEGIERISSNPHARETDMEYIVSWQDADMENIPENLKTREDFKIYPTDSIGISNNRNAAFRHATAPYIMLADDDLEYTSLHLRNIKKGFLTNPDCSILAFKYASPDFPKDYPDIPFELNGRHPKGYHITSFELGFNLEKIRELKGNLQDLEFNPNFGIGGKFFGSGEEDIVVAKMLRRGHKGRFLPSTIAIHRGPTTGMRDGSKEKFIETKGACLSYIKPYSWMPRMLVHAWRACRNKGEARIPFGRYCSWWLAGVKKARENNVFSND